MITTKKKQFHVQEGYLCVLNPGYLDIYCFMFLLALFISGFFVFTVSLAY